MKKIILLLLLFVLCFSTNSFASENDDRYVWIESDNLAGHFFDTKTIKFGKNDSGKMEMLLVDVWIKSVFSEEGKKDFVKKMKYQEEKYENLSYTLDHYVFDNWSRKAMFLASYQYGDNKYLIHKIVVPKEKQIWSEIPPSSKAETLMEKTFEYVVKNKDEVEVNSY